MLLSLFGCVPARRKTRSTTRRAFLRVERLEERCLPSVVPVVNTSFHDSGITTLSQAALDGAGPLSPDSIIDVSYFTTSGTSGASVTAWHGMTAGDASGDYLIAGASGHAVALYDGAIDGSGTSMLTGFGGLVHIFGVDNLGGGHVQLFGEVALFPRVGFMIDGTITDGSFAASRYWLLGTGFCAYAAAGDLAVEDWCYATSSMGASTGFLYDVSAKSALTTVTFPDSTSTSATGIWYNGGTSYTICGSYSADYVNNANNPSQPIGHAFLVDYDSASGTFSHWTSFDDPTHAGDLTTFVAVSSVSPGVYTLAADSAATISDPARGSWVTITRNADGSFGPADWINVSYPGLDPTANATTVTGVYGNEIVGMANGNPFQATVTITVTPPPSSPVLTTAIVNQPSVNPSVFLADNLVVHDLATRPVATSLPDAPPIDHIAGSVPIFDPPRGMPGPLTLPTFAQHESGDGSSPGDLPVSASDPVPGRNGSLPANGQPEANGPGEATSEDVPEHLISTLNEIRGNDVWQLREPAVEDLCQMYVVSPGPVSLDGLAALALLGMLGLENGRWRRKEDCWSVRPFMATPTP